MPSYRPFLHRLSRRTFLSLCSGTTLLGSALSGCGGSKHAGNSEGTRAQGTARLTIRWPDPAQARSRLIPSTTNALWLRVTQTGADSAFTFDRSFGPVTRPAAVTQVSEIVLDSLPVGFVTISASALPAPSNQGETPAALAFGQTQVQILAGQSTPFSLTLESTIAAFRFTFNGMEFTSDTPQTLTIGKTATLSAVALDAGGNLVLTDPNNLAWSISGTALATTPSSGATVTLQGQAASPETGITATLVDQETGKSASVTIRVPAQYRITPLPPGKWLRINDAGEICGMNALNDTGEASLVRDGQVVSLGFGMGSAAVDLNNRGQVLVNAGKTVSLWENGMVTNIPGLFGEDMKQRAGVSLSNNGHVLGKDIIENAIPELLGVHQTPHGWLWHNGTTQPVGGASSGFTGFEPTAVNDSGRVCGLQKDMLYFFYNNGTKCVVQNEGEPAPSAVKQPVWNGKANQFDRIFDIAADGSLLGGRYFPAPYPSPGAHRAYMWPADGYNNEPIDLPQVNGLHLDAKWYPVRMAGQYIVGVGFYEPPVTDPNDFTQISAPAQPRAVLCRGNETLSLNDLIPADSGWSLSTVSAVNAQGLIIGEGTLNGTTTAFLLTPIEVASA